MFYDELQPNPESSEFNQAQEYAELGDLAAKAGEKTQTPEDTEQARADLREILALHESNLATAKAERDRLDQSTDLDPATHQNQMELADINVDYHQRRVTDTIVKLDQLGQSDRRAA